MKHTNCPLCHKNIAHDKPDADELNERPYRDLSDGAAHLYSHINDPLECRAQDAVCPVCHKDFGANNGAYDFPFRRFAIHWDEYGHMPDEEHIAIYLLMGGH